MISGILRICILVVIVLLCLTGPVIASAPISTIMQGNAVFIGEEGLDISAAMGPDTQIGWWAPAAGISSSSPTKTIDLETRMTSFMASPFEFSDYLGNWYRLNRAGKADGVAFLVAEPQLKINAEDATRDVDVELLKWIPTGDDIRFRIDTNLIQMASQRSAPPLITIKVQSPDGAIYSSLLNAGGTPTSIVDIPVNKIPYYTGSIWNMGNRDRYPYGTYTIWAECNVNKMNDNYGATGKTVSRKISLLNQGQNPLITKVTNESTQTIRTPTQVTTQATTQIVVSTTVPTPSPTEPLTPAPSQTKAAGFEATLAGAAIIMGLVLSLKKE